MSPKRLLAILSFLMGPPRCIRCGRGGRAVRRTADSDALWAELGQVRHKIIYETCARHELGVGCCLPTVLNRST